MRNENFKLMGLAQDDQCLLVAGALASRGLSVSQAKIADEHHFRSGFSSDGIRIRVDADVDESVDLFAKVTWPPPMASGEMVQFFREAILAARKNFIGMPAIYGIFGLLADRLCQLDGEEDDELLSQLLSVVTVYQLIDPTQYVPLVDLMRNFGLRAMQSRADNEHPWFGRDQLKFVFQKITEQLVAIHSDRDLLPKDEYFRYEAYLQGIAHVIYSKERFDLINLLGQSLETVASIVTPPHVATLRAGMKWLVSHYAPASYERLAPVHGDSWAANYLVSPDGNHFLIDPAPFPYADPAYDVVFAYADLAITQAKRNQGAEFRGEFTEMAEQFLDTYIALSQDKNLRKYMALFYSSKAFIAAIVDGGDDREQIKLLISSALGVVELAKDPDFKFSFRELDDYAAEGSKIYRSIIELKPS